ncbi:MAG: alginate lyase family protein [Candidatus Eisenbacteria bacterium]|nr:alginate lyase family protein [Candidatus Eisenbacteria bacterium]
MNAPLLVRRVRELGPGMVAYRVGQRLRRRMARARADLLGPRRPGFVEPPDWERTPFFVRAAGRAALAQLLRERCPAALDAVLRDADEALLGRVELLTGERHDFGARVDWHRDPRSGAPAWPVAHFTRLDALRLGESCDIKIPWEVGRGTHLLRMAQAHWLTGEDRYAAGAAAGIEDFTGSNPPEFGPQWITPMEVALRIAHWVWIDRLCAGSPAFPRGTRGRLWWGVLEGARFVSAFRERDRFSGNHYWSNGLGLWYAGAFLGRRGRALARMGREITLGELFAQTRPDGTSIECSTGYHRLVTELALHGLRLADLEGQAGQAAAAPEAARERVRAMVGFVAATLHPGGRAPQLGDHDDGRILSFAPRPPLDHRHLLAVGGAMFDEPAWRDAGAAALDEAAWLAGLDAVGVQPAGAPAEGAEAVSDAPVTRGARRISAAGASGCAFPDGGIYVLRAGAVHSVWDAGPLAKPGNGVHGHADTLSGEVSVDGRPVLVDSGTCAYTSDPAVRNRLRGTAAHNTVQVDGLEMAEPGTGLDLWYFQNGVPCTARLAEGPQGTTLEASHEGYRARGLPVTVRRTVHLAAGGSELRVLDRVEGEGRHRATLRWHLAALEWHQAPDGAVSCGVGGRLVRLRAGAPARGPRETGSGERAGAPGAAGPAAPRARMVAGEHSERWGELHPAPVLELEVTGELPLEFETILEVEDANQA